MLAPRLLGRLDHHLPATPVEAGEVSQGPSIEPVQDPVQPLRPHLERPVQQLRRNTGQTSAKRRGKVHGVDAPRWKRHSRNSGSSFQSMCAAGRLILAVLPACQPVQQAKGDGDRVAAEILDEDRRPPGFKTRWHSRIAGRQSTY